MVLMWMVGRVWLDGKSHLPSIETKNYDGISVIIAARNEEFFIASCLNSILNNDLDSSRWEVIVVDDHSTDSTWSVLESFKHKNLKILQLPTHLTGKKKAVNYGIKASQFSWILLTDADCMVDHNWINDHLEWANKSAALGITGIVLPEKRHSLVSDFQWLDFAATMALTNFGIQSHLYYLSNGANFGFAKSVFESVHGFEGNDYMASGDDVFLMQKFSRINPYSAYFLQSTSAIVTTKSEPDWKALLQQRKRWASKSKHKGNEGVVYIQGFVFIYCIAIVLAMFGGIFSTSSLYVGIIAMLIKMATDYIFLRRMAHYFDYPQVLRSFLPSYFIYFMHIFVSAWFAIFPSKFWWKSRSVR